jgi:hypothetical protein
VDFFPEIHLSGKRLVFADHVLQRFSQRENNKVVEDVSSFLNYFFNSVIIGMLINKGEALIMPNIDAFLAFTYRESETELFITTCLSLNEINELKVRVPSKAFNLHYGEPSNSFEEHVDGNSRVGVDTNGNALAPVVANEIPASSSKPASLVAPSSPPPAKFNEVKTEQPAFRKYLDESLHKVNWEFCQYMVDCKDEVHLSVASEVVNVISRMVQGVRPEDLMHFVQIDNQKQLEEEVLKWSAGYFSAHYEKHLSQPNHPENDACLKLFMFYCERILCMAFHWVKFPDAGLYCCKDFAYLSSSQMNPACHIG